MAHFYGKVSGSAKTEATRLGRKDTGLVTVAASWSGAVQVRLYHVDGEDRACVKLVPWHGKGVYHTLYDGPVNGAPFRAGE